MFSSLTQVDPLRWAVDSPVEGGSGVVWAAQGSLGNNRDGEKPAAAMYGDFRAAKEGAEEVRWR